MKPDRSATLDVDALARALAAVRDAAAAYHDTLTTLTAAAGSARVPLLTLAPLAPVAVALALATEALGRESADVEYAIRASLAMTERMN